MKQLNTRGESSLTVVLLILSSSFLMFAIIFGLWAFMSRQDYKNNVDTKIDAAVATALEDQRIELEAEFAEEEKSPYVSYTSSQSLGSVKLTYPKTWDAYIIEADSQNSSKPVEGYFNPGFVPGVNTESSYALRFEIVDATIDKELESYNGQLATGTVTINAYRPESVPNARAGYRIDGEILQKRQGSLVLIPVRDKTVKIWTEQQDFINDLDSIILANLSFIP